MKIFCSILFILISICSTAQQRGAIDSLHIELKNKNLRDTTKIDVLNLLVKAYSPYHFDTALSYANTAYQLSTKIKDKKRIAWTMNRLGIVYDYNSNIDSALYWFRKSVNSYRLLGDSSRMADVYINAGVCFHFGTMYDSALSYYIKATELKEKIGADNNLGYALNNIGLIFRLQGNFRKAITYYQKSLELKNKHNDQVGTITSLGNLATLYQSIGKYDSAELLINQSLEMAESIKDTSLIAWNYVNLGQNHYYKKNYKESLRYQLKVKNTYSEYLEHRDLLLNSFCLAETYRNLKNSKQATHYYLKSEQMAEAMSMSETLVNVYAGLSALHADNSDYKKSLYYHKKYDSLTDLMFNKEKTSVIEGLERKYQSELKEKEIAQLEFNQQRSDYQQNILLLVAVMVILMSIFLYFLLRSKMKTNVIISQSLEEKETLLKEIHHRVKNNLQVISSLLSLQSRYIKDNTAVQAVTESKNRVKSMALIHQKLYQKDNLIGIDMVDYIENLTDSLFTSYGIEKSSDTWELDVESLRLDIDTTIPLGLIINELVSNSLKHAFTKSNQTKLILELRKQSEELVLIVKDNGRGFSLDRIEERDSFGLNLIDSLARKLEAHVNIDGSNGAYFSLNIKKFKLI